MKTKALGVMAAALLAGPISAQATVIYEVTVGGAVMIHYESPDFVTTNTDILLTNSPGSVCNFVTADSQACGSFGLYPEPQNFDTIGWCTEGSGCYGTNGNFQNGALGMVGTYLGGPTPDLEWTLTVTSRSAVPEPGTLALLGLGLAGLGLGRRRKVA